jgi:hypothetical protein
MSTLSDRNNAKVQASYNSFIEYFNDNYYMEDGSNSKKQGLLKRIRDFFNKSIDRIKDFFDSKKVQKVSELKLNDNAKIKISAKEQKLIDQGKISMAELQKCKTPEEAEKIMNNYRRKKKAILAITATAAISVTAAIAWLKHGKTKQINDAKKMQKDTEAYILYDGDDPKMKELSNRARELSEQYMANLKAMDAMEINHDTLEAIHQINTGILNEIKDISSTITQFKMDEIANGTNRSTPLS